MSPDFALSLSFDGIRLLHRTAEGWVPLGEVPLDSRDLAADLAALRRAGEALGAPWRGTKLLLPAEQVRVLSLEGELGEDEVRAALEGLTPYAPAELVLDRVQEGGRTHVAAVARETLEEAEAFAAEHGFRPACFAAPLPGTAFPGEAFFGPAKGAAALLEGEPVTGEAEEAPLPAAEAALPTLEPVEALSPEVPPEAPVQGPIPAETAPEAGPEPLPAAEPAALTGAVEAAGPELAAPAAAADGAAAEAAPPPVAEAAPSEQAASEPAVPADPTPSAPVAGPGEAIFASHAPPLRGPARDGAPRPEGQRGAEGARIEPTLGPAAPGAAPSAGWALSAPPPGGRRDPRVPPGPAASAAISARREPVAAPVPRAAPEDLARPVAETAPAAAAATTPVPRAKPEPRGRVGGKPRYLGLVLTLVLLVIMGAVAVLASVSEQGLAGLFRQGDAPQVASAPETAEPPPEVASAAPALEAPPSGPAPDLPSEEAAGLAPEAPALPDPDAAEADLAAAPDPEDAQAAAAAVAAALAELPAEEAPLGPAPAGLPVSPAEADRFYAATGVWLRAPRLPQLPPAAEGAGEGPALAALSEDKALPVPPVLAAVGPDAALRAPIDPPPPGDTFARDERGLILATPEGTLAPSGVLLFAGPPALVPPTRPGTPAPDEAALAGAEPEGWVNAMDEPPGRRPPADRPEPPEAFLAALAGPAVEAAPSAAEAEPAWVNAMDAPPERTPPLRPAPPPEFLALLAAADPVASSLPSALAFAAMGPPQADPALADLRPAARPGDLAEPEPVILASFDGPLPGPRPDDLAPETALPEEDEAVAEAPEAPEEEPAPDLQATLAAIVQGAPDPLAGATPRAVAVARVPDARPRNFDGVVREQLERLAAAAQPQGAASGGGGGGGASGLAAHEEAEAGEAEVASGAAAVPSGVTATTVAAAATFADAMSLREINLIGVYGQPGNRRALVRMGNGSYLRVGVGDNLDGGRVTAIGDNALNYLRRGRTEVLVIPGG